MRSELSFTTKRKLYLMRSKFLYFDKMRYKLIGMKFDVFSIGGNLISQRENLIYKDEI